MKFIFRLNRATQQDFVFRKLNYPIRPQTEDCALYVNFGPRLWNGLQALTKSAGSVSGFKHNYY